eukprot:gene22681-39460_t
MGSNLFGSFAEASCAALVVSASSSELLKTGWGALMFPLLISAFGIFVCLVTSFLATHVHDGPAYVTVALAATALAHYRSRPPIRGFIACAFVFATGAAGVLVYADSDLRGAASSNVMSPGASRGSDFVYRNMFCPADCD